MISQEQNKIKSNSTKNSSNPRRLELGSALPLCFNRRSNDKLDKEEKREITKDQLAVNFPTYLTLSFGLIYLLIGLVAIALQVVLIFNMALNYEIANGIWGGFFAILNGFIKLTMG